MAVAIPPPKEDQDQALGPRQSFRSSFYNAFALHGGAIVRAPSTNLRVLTRWLSMDRPPDPEGAGQIQEDSPQPVPVLPDPEQVAAITAVLLDPEQVAAITAVLRDAIIDGAHPTLSLTQRRVDSLGSDSSGGDDDEDQMGHPSDQHMTFPRIESLKTGDFSLFFVPGSAPGLPDAPQGHGVSRLSDVYMNPWILKADTETFSGPCELTSERTRIWIMRFKITTILVVLIKQQLHEQNWEQCFSEVAGQHLEQLLIVACSFSDARWSDVHISQMLTVFDTVVDVLVNIKGLCLNRSDVVAGIVKKMVHAFEGVIQRTSNEIRRSREFTIHPATFVFIQGLEFFFRNRDMVQSLLESGGSKTCPFSDMFECFKSKLTEYAETNFQEQGQRYIFVLNNMYCVLQKDCLSGLLPHSVRSKLDSLVDQDTASYLNVYWIPLTVTLQSYLDGVSLKKPRRSSVDKFLKEFLSIFNSQKIWKVQTSLKVILREEIVKVIILKYAEVLVALQESRSLHFPPWLKGKWQFKYKKPKTAECLEQMIRDLFEG